MEYETKLHNMLRHYYMQTSEKCCYRRILKFPRTQMLALCHRAGTFKVQFHHALLCDCFGCQLVAL
jgi:hypothetical protein